MESAVSLMVTDGRTSMGNPGADQEQTVHRAWHFVLRRFLETAAECLGKLTLHLLSAQPKQNVDELTRPTTESTGESYERRKQNDTHAA